MSSLQIKLSLIQDKLAELEESNGQKQQFTEELLTHQREIDSLYDELADVVTDEEESSIKSIINALRGRIQQMLEDSKDRSVIEEENLLQAEDQRELIKHAISDEDLVECDASDYDHKELEKTINLDCDDTVGSFPEGIEVSVDAATISKDEEITGKSIEVTNLSPHPSLQVKPIVESEMLSSFEALYDLSSMPPTPLNGKDGGDNPGSIGDRFMGTYLPEDHGLSSYENIYTTNMDRPVVSNSGTLQPDLPDVRWSAPVDNLQGPLGNLLKEDDEANTSSNKQCVEIGLQTNTTGRVD